MKYWSIIIILLSLYACPVFAQNSWQEAQKQMQKEEKKRRKENKKASKKEIEQAEKISQKWDNRLDKKITKRQRGSVVPKASAKMANEQRKINKKRQITRKKTKKDLPKASNNKGRK